MPEIAHGNKFYKCSLGFFQDHPLRASLTVMLDLTFMVWYAFGGWLSCTFLYFYIIESRIIPTDKLISLFTIAGLVGPTLGVLVTLVIWGRYLFFWNKVKPFSKQLSDADVQARRIASFELARLLNPLAVRPLLQVLQDSDDEVRGWAIWGLGNVADSRAVMPLLDVLKGSDGDMRDGAAQALGYMNDDRVIEPLIQLLQDSNAAVRSTAAMALSNRKALRVLKPLTQTLQDSDAFVRWHVAWALEKIGDASIVPALYPLRDDPNLSVREAAARAIEHLQTPEPMRPPSEAISSREFSDEEVNENTVQNNG